MLTVSGVWRQVLVASVVCVLSVCLVQADPGWYYQYWQDDFEDGDYTANPTWSTLGAGATHSVVGWEGDNAFRLQTVGGGWAGAYVNYLEGDQGIAGWVDTSPVSSDAWAAVAMLRYNTPTLGFGTGYALGITHLASGAMVAQLYQLDDTANPAITDPVVVSPTYQDLWFRFLATGTGSSTLLQAKVWSGATEPELWMLSSDSPGSEPGITNYYNSGHGGVGVVSTSEEVLGDAYFDDLKYGVPEPTTMALFAAGIGALVLRRRRRK